MLGFQRGSTLKFLKNFRTFFCEISVQRHGVMISIQPIRKGLAFGAYSNVYYSLVEQSYWLALAHVSIFLVCFEGLPLENSALVYL